jgi:hypothetical protein
MKDQYFGDINDYRKYGLLRCIDGATGFKTLVAWMLTADDDGNDGQKVTYLDKGGELARLDPPLFEALRNLLKDSPQRQVSLIEASGLLPNTEFFSTHVPDSSFGRGRWFDSLMNQIQDVDIVFFDPDNGLEIKSKPYGQKYSSKFLYWREVETLWKSGKSLLIYQHFIREKRSKFVQRMLGALSESTPGSLLEAFATPHVVFLMALQPRHHHLHQPITQSVQSKWGELIWHWN